MHDTETTLYYLQSRYYDPELGRFINADAFASTGHGLLGNNMFAYCNNSPLVFADDTGTGLTPCTVVMNDCTGGGRYNGITSNANYLNPPKNNRTNFTKTVNNSDIDEVYSSEHYGFYKGVLVIRHSSDYLTSWSVAGVIFLNHSNDKFDDSYKSNLLNHEYGHILQEREFGTVKYLAAIFVPSVAYNFASRYSPSLNQNYYNMPWEYDADARGGVNREHSVWARNISNLYNFLVG